MRQTAGGGGFIFFYFLDFSVENERGKEKVPSPEDVKEEEDEEERGKNARMKFEECVQRNRPVRLLGWSFQGSKIRFLSKKCKKK